MNIQKPVAYLIGIIILAGCSSGSDESDLLDYSQIPDLELSLVLEVGETDEFLPGNLSDMVVTSQGHMLVSDWSRTSIEQISADGEYLGSVATQGGGPGELTQWFFIRNKGNDTLMVQHQSGMFAFYGPDDGHNYRFAYSLLRESIADWPMYIVGPRSETEYYASAGRVIRDVEAAIRNPDTHSLTKYVVANAKMMIVQDSIFNLRTPNSHIHSVGGGIAVYGVPYRVGDVMRVLNDGNYLIARPDSGTITFHDKNFKVEKQIKLNVPERLLSTQEINRALEQIRESVRQDILPKIPSAKPVFLDFWATGSHLFLHTDNLEDGKEIVVLDGDGGPVGRFIIDNIDTIKHFSGNKIYVLSKDPDHGDMIRVYEWQ
jgi:hypothetical protein